MSLRALQIPIFRVRSLKKASRAGKLRLASTYTPTDATVPPARTDWIAWVNGVSWPTHSSTTSGPRPPVNPRSCSAGSPRSRLGAELLGQLQPIVDAVDREGPRGPEERSLELAEVAESNAQARHRGASRRRPQADHLGLALPSVAAVGERVVAPARMRHELGHARRQRSKVREGASERPVRAGSGLAEEVVGSPQARRQGPGARGLVLAPDGHAEAPRGVEHDFGDGRQQTDVMVRVEMRRLAPHQHGELLELGAHLALDVPRVGAGRGRSGRRCP